MIPYSRQQISEADIESVVEVLKSDFLTQGPKVPEFEKSLSAHSESKYAFAMNSATSALHVACMAIGLSKNDWLWTSPITFVASANAGLYCGANVDFVDIDPNTYNMCPLELEKKLIKAKLENNLPKVLIPVHLSGQPCDMKSIHRLCSEYDVKIIEDASHAIGGCYLGEPIGNCKYSNITVLSFHPVKIITTAEGGAALTNDKELAKKIELLRSHGITRNEEMMKEVSHGPWYYQQLELGYNYRMTDIQGALGYSQMTKLAEFVASRHRIAKKYNSLLSDLPIKLPTQINDAYSSYHLYIIRLNLNKISTSHKEIFEGLRSAGIGVNLHYIPVHLHPFYQSLGFKYGDYPESERYYSEAISLPIYPNLLEKDQNTVVQILKSLLI